MTGINESMLRAYDNSGLFSPQTRFENGYRAYAIEQVVAVKYIRFLNTIGVSQRAIQQFYKKRNPSNTLDLLSQGLGSIDNEIARLSEIRDIMYIYSKLITRGVNTQDESKVTVRGLEQYAYYLGPKNNFGQYEFYDAFTEYCHIAKDAGINLCFPIGGYWSSAEEYFANPDRPEGALLLASSEDIRRRSRAHQPAGQLCRRVFAGILRKPGQHRGASKRVYSRKQH